MLDDTCTGVKKKDAATTYDAYRDADDDDDNDDARTLLK